MQYVIDKKVYNQKLNDVAVRKLAWDELQKNIVMNGGLMIDIRTREDLGPEADYTCWKEKLKVNFTVFLYHKIIYCKGEGLHVLNDIYILDI